MTKDGKVWLGTLANAYRYNCETLKVLRGEDPVACDEALR